MWKRQQSYRDGNVNLRPTNPDIMWFYKRLSFHLKVWNNSVLFVTLSDYKFFKKKKRNAVYLDTFLYFHLIHRSNLCCRACIHLPGLLFFDFTTTKLGLVTLTQQIQMKCGTCTAISQISYTLSWNNKYQSNYVLFLITSKICCIHICTYLHDVSSAVVLKKKLSILRVM